MRPPPHLMQCAHQSRNGTCVASCSTLSLCVGLFLGPALTRLSDTANSSPSTSSPFFNCIQFCLFISFHLFLVCCFTSTLPASQACRKRLDHSLSLPAENWTVSSRQIHMSIVYTHVQLDHCSVSSVSNVRILSVQHNNISTWDDILH